MTTLYTLASQYEALEDLANATLENDENVDEDTIEMFIDTLDAIQDSMENKFENIGKFIKNLEGDVAKFKLEEKRLANRRKTMENKINGMKEYSKDMLIKINKDKMQAGIFRVRLQKNNPSVEIIDPKLIPAKYKIEQEPTIDKKGILAALKNEETVEGATFAPESKHIRFE